MGYIIIKNLYKQHGGGNLNLKKNLSGEKSIPKDESLEKNTQTASN